MPQPHLRTRSEKRLKLRLAGGRSRIHYRKGKVSPPSCRMCNQPLAGIARLATAGIRKLNRTKRRIWRPYGLELCHKCLKTALKQAIKAI